MAKGKPITHDELIENDVFQNTIEQAVALRTELTKLIGGFKQLAAVTGKKITNVDPKSITEAQQLARAYEELAKIQKGYTEGQKQLVYVKEKIKFLTKQENDAIKANVQVQNTAKGSIAEMRAELKKLTIEWANLEDIEGKNAERFEQLSQQKLELTNKIKALEAATGDHRREVGNYGKAVEGLSGGLFDLAEAFGVNAEWLEALDKSHKKLFKGLRDLQEGFHASGVAQKAETAATKEGEAAQKAASAARLGAIPVIGLVIVGLLALGAAIYAVVLKTQMEEEAERERSRAVDGSIIKNKELRDAYNEHLAVLSRISNEYRVLRGEITRTEASIDNIKTKTKIAVANIRNETAEKVEEAKSIWGTLKDFLLNFGNEGMTGFAKQYAIRVGGAIKEGNDKIKAEITKSGDEIKDLKLEQDKKDIEDRLRFIEQTVRIAELKGDLTLQKEIEFLKKQEALALVLARDRGESLLLVQRDYEIKRLEVIEKYFRKEIDKINEQIKKQAEKWKEDYENFKQETDKKSKKADEFYKRQIQLIMENEKKEAELRLRKDKKDKDIRNDKVALENAEFQQRIEALSNQYDAEQKKTEAYHKAQELLKKEHEQNLADIEKEFQLKKFQDAINFQQTLLNAFERSMDNRNELERKGLEYQADLYDKQIEIQTELAAAGQDNQLDYALKKKAENIAEQKELDRKAQRQKEGLQLAQIYLEFLQVYAKDGPAASAKALTQTLIAKGITAAFVGAFKDGVENLEGEGTETSDSNLALLSKGESVVTAKGTKENPGLATAMNTGRVEEYFRNIYLPKVDPYTDKSRDQLIAEGVLSVVGQKLDEIKDTLGKQKHFWIEKNVLDQIFYNDLYNGVHTRTTRERNPIVKRETHKGK